MENNSLLQSNEIQELYDQFNEIYPDQLICKEHRQYVLTIPYELEEEIPCYIPRLTSKEFDIPLMYKGKEEIMIRYIQPLEVIIQFTEKDPYFQFNCPWLSINDIIEIQNIIKEECETFGNELFMILYSILIDRIPTSINLKTGIEKETQYQTIKEVILYDYNKRIEIFNQAECHECQLCCEEYPPNKFVFLESCFHWFCHDCMKSSLDVCLKNGKKMSCPFAGCSCEILPHTMKNVCSNEKITQYEEQLTKLLIRKEGEDLFICPFCDQTILVTEDLFKNPTPIHCCACQRTFCSHCMEPNHVGSCRILKSAEYYTSSIYKDYLLTQSMMKKMKRCPKCMNIIVKIYGCDYVVCVCGASFCYNCLQTWDNHSQCIAVGEHLTEKEIDKEIELVAKYEKFEEYVKKYYRDDWDTFPFFCEECHEITEIPKNHLVIVCKHCKSRYCRHCEEKNVDAKHVEVALRRYSKMNFSVPSDYKEWK